MQHNRILKYLDNVYGKLTMQVANGMTQRDRDDLIQLLRTLVRTGELARAALDADATIAPDERLLHTEHIERLTHSSRKLLKVLS